MIIVKSPAEVLRMKKAGKFLGDILEQLRDQVRPGIMTKELDAWIDERIRAVGGIPSFLGYRGYPAATCISVNDEVVHGIPSSRRLEEGDIVGIDVGLYIDGFHADAARSFAVGDVDPRVQAMIDTAREAFFAGIANARAGKRVGDISHAVQTCVENAGCSVVRTLIGHGIGRNMHEAPDVPNFGSAGRGPRLSAGMALAVEPMINLGAPEVVQLDDGWTMVTEDGSPSAHYENTVVVQREGPPLILTEDCGCRVRGEMGFE